MKVLLVEDDEALASGLTLALDNAGVLVEVAGDGRSADFLVSTERYDAIILDLGLPDGNGTQWLSAWRDRGIELPVLILTARDRWSDKAAGFSAGADDYVTKPLKRPKFCSVYAHWYAERMAMRIRLSVWVIFPWTPTAPKSLAPECR